MFDANASHGRKFWGFQLVEKALRRLSPDQMPLIFTANFMRTFINNLASEDRFLNKAAKHTVSCYFIIVSIGFIHLFIGSCYPNCS
jgi:DNA polymerase phi